MKFLKKKVEDPEVMETEIEEMEEEETEMKEKKGISKRTKLIIGGTAAGLLAIAGTMLFKKSKSDDYYEFNEVDPDSDYDEETEELNETEDAEGGSDEE